MISKEKIILIAEKHSTKISMIIAGLIIGLVFILGRASINIPPKSVVCESEIATISAQYKTIETLQLNNKKDLEEQRDVLNKECTSKISEELEKFKSSNSSLDCKVCKSLVRQCKVKGEPICK
jgi:hypothetical protein